MTPERSEAGNRSERDGLQAAWWAVVHGVTIHPWETDLTAPEDAQRFAEGWNRCRERVLEVLAEQALRSPHG